MLSMGNCAFVGVLRMFQIRNTAPTFHPVHSAQILKDYGLIPGCFLVVLIGVICVYSAPPRASDRQLR